MSEKFEVGDRIKWRKYHGVIKAIKPAGDTFKYELAWSNGKSGFMYENGEIFQELKHDDDSSA